MRTAINIGLIVACIIIIPFLGLFTTVGLYLAVHMFFLGVRPVSLVVFTAAGAVLVMYCFFGLLLGVQFPNTLLV